MKIVERGNKLYFHGLIGDKRYRTALGLESDPIGLLAASRLLDSIKLDCALGEFKGSIEAYKPLNVAAKTPKKRYPDHPRRYPLSPEEIRKILDAFYQDTFKPASSAYKHSHYAAFIHFLALTGCRPAEAIGLQGSHIDLEGRLIVIESVLARGLDGGTSSRKRRRKSTKTGNKRVFEMSESLYNLLKDRPLSDYELVFKSPMGLSIDDNNLSTRIWKRILSGLEIEHRCLYALRHSFAQNCLNAGVPITTIAYLMGHSNIDTTVKQYLHKNRKAALPDLF